jgi:hypothetical protein
MKPKTKLLIMKKEKDLTKEQIERQDFVDNSILQLLNDLNPNNKTNDTTNIKIIDVFDGMMIGQIRDVIETALTVHYQVCTEQEFYPYLTDET